MSARNRFRIIAGDWRGRRLAFPDAAGLRPTAERVRETLFNWLQAELAGARCLDLFAGSGALGFEALSRGAARVDFVERGRAPARAIAEAIEILHAQPRARLYTMDAAAFLKGRAEPYQLVFLDPPFQSAIIGRCCQRLAEGDWLADGARVYVEVDRHRGLPALPRGWQVIKNGEAGTVAYHLIATASSADGTG